MSKFIVGFMVALVGIAVLLAYIWVVAYVVENPNIQFAMVIGPIVIFFCTMMGAMYSSGFGMMHACPKPPPLPPYPNADR